MTHQIAFVLPSFAGGGAERVMVTLARELRSMRRSTLVIAFDARGPARGLLTPDIQVIDLGVSRLRQAFPRLLGVLRRLKPDMIVSTMGYVNLGLLALSPFLANRPKLIVREANSPTASVAATGWPRATASAYRFLYPGAGAVICPSRAIAHELESDFGISHRLLHVLPNPVDEAEMRRLAISPARVPGRGRRFVAAGRLTYQKGFDQLIDWLVDEDSSDHLMILGDGPEMPPLTEAVVRRGLGDRVRLAGRVESPAAWYAGADAFLMPSRWEGMPNAVLEALAVGTPVIAKKEAGAVGEVSAAAAAGAVTVCADSTAFKEAMRRVIAEPPTEIRRSLLPPQFHIDRSVHAYASLLDGLLPPK